MKEFRKTKDGLFICEECGRTFKKLCNLSPHIGKYHNKKKYFDKWIKDENDGKCKICKKETPFLSLVHGYKNYCSDECAKKLHYINLKLSNLKKYGVENTFQSKEKKEKIKETKRERYNDENYNNREKCKQTYLERYGVEYISQLKEIKEKKEQTCLKNHGVKAGFANVEKRKHTCLKHFGVENPSQDFEIHKKQQFAGFKAKKFRNTNIYYRGSYELDFLEKYYDKYPDILNPTFIKYKFKRKNCYYFPDFYIPSKNLIIECKNSYLAEKNKMKIEYQKQAVINAGYNYIMIINKDYSKIMI